MSVGLAGGSAGQCAAQGPGAAQGRPTRPTGHPVDPLCAGDAAAALLEGGSSAPDSLGGGGPRGPPAQSGQTELLATADDRAGGDAPRGSGTGPLVCVALEDRSAAQDP